MEMLYMTYWAYIKSKATKYITYKAISDYHIHTSPGYMNT